MPIKTPLSFLLEQKATFRDAVNAVGRSISVAKKHEMFPFLSLIEEARREVDNSLLDFKVAVTLSPRLSEKSCKLYPVEGVWDLFFCFLEQEEGVSLGVCHLQSHSMYDTLDFYELTPSGHCKPGNLRRIRHV